MLRVLRRRRRRRVSDGPLQRRQVARGDERDALRRELDQHSIEIQRVITSQAKSLSRTMTDLTSAPEVTFSSLLKGLLDISLISDGFSLANSSTGSGGRLVGVGHSNAGRL